MMLKPLQKRGWTRPVAAGVLALVIMSMVFTVKGVTPFGSHNLLISDMGGQYLSFFTAYRHALLEHNFQLYSFSQSLGGSAVPTVAYYLLSPFNLLILLFPAASLPTGLSIIIMVKIAMIAVTMTWFLQSHYQTRAWSTAIFGVAFSLCGFVALNYFTIMWLDALIWLPLVIMGLEHLIKTGKPAAFFWWLWVSIVTDYYLGYMTCLFVVYYFVYQLFEMKAPGTSLWQAVKTQSHLIGKIVLTALLSGLSSLFILIPTLLGMLKTAKSAVKVSSYLPIPQFGFKALSQFGLGANYYSTRLEHAPTLFSTTLVTLLVLTFFVAPHILRAHKWHVGGLLFALLLSMEIKTLDTMWHMFQRPAGFPYREAFFFSFVMVMVAFEAWQAHPQAIARGWQWLLPSGLMVALAIGWWSQRGKPYPLATRTFLLSLAFVLVTAAVLFMTRRRLRTVLLAGIVTAELTANGVLTMHKSPLGNETAFNSAYQTEYRQMQAVNDPDGQLYRVENQNTLINEAYNYNSKYRNYNDPMLFNFHDITYYSSTFENQTRLMLKSLGLFSKNVRRVSSEGLNPVSEMLLGIKYSVTLNATGKSTTTPTASHTGMGFAVPTAFQQLSLRANSALVNQEHILQSLRPSKSRYFANANVLKDQVTRNTGAKTYHYQHTIQLRANATGHLYYDDTLTNTKYTTMRVNGHLVPTKFNPNGGIVLRDLGYFDKGTVVTLTVSRKTKTLGTHVHLASLNQSQFETVYRGLRSSAFVPEYHAVGLGTVVSGTINNSQNRRWLYVAIPADSGWHVTVNGRNVSTKTTTMLDGMIGVPITSGKNHVKLVYHVPGALTGATISVVSLLTFTGLAAWWRRRNPRLTHSQSTKAKV